MTQEEILEYNKRCAYFLGWKYIEDGDIWNPGISYNYSFIYTDNLQFRSDWNWIMEVVEAIDKIQHTQVDILGKYCRISSKGIDFKGSSKEDKKEAVVQAINQFLIWYKNNILNNGEN